MDKDEDSISEDSSDDDNNDEQLESQITELRNKLCDNPFDYNSHVLLIDNIRKSCDLDKLREARENMAEKFPLTPELWLQWIRDESKLVSDDDQRKYVFQLFERANNDYVSVDLWLEYVQFSICLLETEDGLKKIRSIFEKAIDAVGIHVQNGSLIWEAFREFEKSIISITDAEQMSDQCGRIFTLFKRQFSIPLIQMETKFAEFIDWVSEMKTMGQNYDPSDVKFVFDKSLVELQKLKPYEDSLIVSSNNFDDYLKYIEYEEANGTPPRVQSIYERAILEHCLIADLWLRYTSFLDSKVKISSISMNSYERALRNCPWVVDLWIGYIRSLERIDESRDKITKIFEKALQSGFSTGEDFKKLWLCYLDYLRRKTDFNDEQQIEKLRKCFNTASDHLSNLENGDPEFEVLQYLAKLEAKFCKNIENARNIWKNSLLNHRSVSGKAKMWIHYANLERNFGDESNFRKILLKALNSVNDFPETIGELLINYEREEGISIENLDESLKKYAKAMEKIIAKRKAVEKSVEHNKPISDKIIESKGKRKLKTVGRNTAEDLEENFLSKKPKIDATSVKSCVDTAVKSPPKFVKPEGDDELRKLQTAFISNLNFNTTEDQIKEVFSQFGAISDVRLVRKYNGLSKGYAYVEFENIQGVKEAIKNDRMPIDGRPVFISEMGKRSFKYRTGLEHNKLFIDNLSVDVTQDELRDIFQKYGDLLDVRVVTFRNGHSKGKAYVEYKDEVGARKALEANGMTIREQNISVAISNPPPKRNKNDPMRTLGSASFTGHQMQHAKMRIGVPMIPTSLRRQQFPKNGTDNNVQPSSSMSNNDFRNLFKK